MATRAQWMVGEWASQSLARQVVSVLAGTLLLALSARVQIPFWPVPFSMQTFVVLALGMVYGPALGAATVLAYLGQGLVGLPVFVAGGGPAYLAGPTGGYLLGMVPAAWVAGELVRRGWGADPIRAVAAAAAGNMAVYVLGVTWLAVWLGSVSQAVTVGLLPFLPGAAMKVAGAGLLVWGLTRCAGKRE
ncbi:biotin transporter BioY [Spiribacter onubensis]|uniref:Biotin transporter n=1 Tax=Spiribacter onubensis TaxID=3122420 RepID=A0ABV3S772_9GAMM